MQNLHSNFQIRDWSRFCGKDDEHFLTCVTDKWGWGGVGRRGSEMFCVCSGGTMDKPMWVSRPLDCLNTLKGQSSISFYSKEHYQCVALIPCNSTLAWHRYREVDFGGMDWPCLFSKDIKMLSKLIAWKTFLNYSALLIDGNKALP